MRIIKESTLRRFADDYPEALDWLRDIATALEAADWGSIQDVRRFYPHADPAVVESGKTVTIFNVKGNKYRLVMAMHYNRGVAYVLRFMTHAEYSKDRWKQSL